MQEPRKRKAGSFDTVDLRQRDEDVGRLLKYPQTQNHEDLLPKRHDDSTPEDEAAFLRASQQGWRPSEKIQKHKQHLKSSSKAKSENEGMDEMRDHLVYEKNSLIKKKRKKVKSGSESDFASPPLLFGANIGSKDDGGSLPRKALKEHSAHDGFLDEALVRSSAKGLHLDPAR